MLTFKRTAFKTERAVDLHLLDLRDFILAGAGGGVADVTFVAGACDTALSLVKETALLGFLNGTHPRA